MYRIRATYIPNGNTHFDKQYYVDHHISLAHRHTQGKVPIEKIELEWDTVLLLETGTLKSPLVFNVYVRTKDDVESFRNFLQSEAANQRQQYRYPTRSHCQQSN